MSRVARQQLVRRDLVDLGEAQQAGHGDRPLAPLVRAEHRRLELEVRARLDVVQREPLLAADRPQPFADVHAMHRFPAAPEIVRARPAETIPRSLAACRQSRAERTLRHDSVT